MSDIISKAEDYLRRTGMHTDLIDAINLSALPEEVVPLLGQYLYRREREMSLLHDGVTPKALAKWKRIRPRAETDETEDDGSPRADIVIDGVITDDQSKEMASAEAGMVSPADVQKQIDAIPEGTDEVRVLINSPGGSVFAAQTMIDQLNDVKGAMIVRIRGIAASAGALIAIRSNDEMEMSAGSFLMTHSSMLNGMNSQQLADAIGILEKVDEGQVDAVYAASTLTKEEARASIAKETWYSDKEAFEAGFLARPPESPVRSGGKKKRRTEAEAKSDVVPSPLGQPGPSQGLSAVGRNAMFRARQLFSNRGGHVNV